VNEAGAGRDSEPFHELRCGIFGLKDQIPGRLWLLRQEHLAN
jgi:hypothetical protein